MSELAHIADHVVGLQRGEAPSVCYFLLFEDKAIGVLYWDSHTMADIGPVSN